MNFCDEKPVGFYMSDTENHFAKLYTGHEPPGEGEGPFVQ
jgi:hypothetical protein